MSGEPIAEAEVNAVQIAVAEQFPPELWSEDVPVRMQVADIIGLHPDFFYSWIQTDNDRRHPEWEWMALLFGSEVVGGGGDQPVRFRSLPVEMLPAVHEYLKDKVLYNEDVRPSKFVTPPVPEIRAPRNGVFWLDQMASGHWGLTCYPSADVQADGTRKTVRSAHDYESYHPAVFMTLGRESQAYVTKVTRYQRDWLLTCIDDETDERIPGSSLVLRLPTDTSRDPYNAGPDKNGEGGYQDGMHIIDCMTDDASHLLVLHHLMHDKNGTTPEERLQALEAYVESERQDGDATLHQAVAALTFMRKYHAAMANFIMRHEHRRNITPEEAEAAYRDYTKGTVRVVKKISGTWTETDELADQTERRSKRAAALAQTALV